MTGWWDEAALVRTPQSYYFPITAGPEVIYSFNTTAVYVNTNHFNSFRNDTLYFFSIYSCVKYYGTPAKQVSVMMSVIAGVAPSPAFLFTWDKKMELVITKKQ